MAKTKIPAWDETADIPSWDDTTDSTAAPSSAPALGPKPTASGGIMNGIKEGLRYIAPSRVAYAESHPKQNSIQGQIMGPGSKPSMLGEIGADLEDVSSLPRRMVGAGVELAKLNPAGAKAEMQKTEGDHFLENMAREAPTMFIPGGAGRSAAKGAIESGIESAPKLLKYLPGTSAAEGSLALKPVIEAPAAARGMLYKGLDAVKAGGQKLLEKMGHSAAAVLPQAGYHQLKSIQETGKTNPVEGAAELAGGALLPIPLAAAGKVAKAVPQFGKFILSQTTGANRAALQRASEKGGVTALKAVAGEQSAENLADELITTLGRKEDLLAPDPANAREILPNLPRVPAVEPMSAKNTVAMSNGKPLQLDLTGRLEPVVTDNRPSASDLRALDKMGPGEGLPVGNEKHADLGKQFKREATDRSIQAGILGQTVKKALREVGPIYVDDNLRAQLGLSGRNWQTVMKDYGLDMFTADKKLGKSLDVAGMEIAEKQAQGKFEGLQRITDESDLVNALSESLGKKTRGLDENQAFLENAIRTGEHLDDTQVIQAGNLGKGDFVKSGQALFRVAKNADGEVILEGPTKVIVKNTDQLHIDKGSRVTPNPEEFPRDAIFESMDIPPQAKVAFVKTIEKGRERFRDILQSKVNETVRTPEKAKTVKKLQELLDLADNQLQGRESLSAVEADQFKRDYQEVLAEQYKSRDSDEYFSAYKSLAHSLRSGIEEAANKSGNEEYVKIMRNLANKLRVVDKVETRFVGEQITKSQEKAARQIRIITNDAQKPALKELEVMDKIFGTNFAERAKDIGYAKMLQMGADGVPLLPLQTTGRALLGVSAGAQIYKGKDGEVNPLALAGMLLSSPRLAVYAFQGLNMGAKLGPVAAKVAAKAGPKLLSSGYYDEKKENGGQ